MVPHIKIPINLKQSVKRIYLVKAQIMHALDSCCKILLTMKVLEISRAEYF